MNLLSQILTGRFIHILLLLFLSILSICLKLKDIENFSNFDNFFTNHDAYRYARYAIEIQNNAYGRIDYLSYVPDFGVNQYPPPLLSQITVWLSDLLNSRIEYLFLILPPFLSVLFIIPLYFWLKPLKNDFVVFGAITMGLFSFFYFVRTRMGYFDTDCMILFFVFLTIYFISKASIETENFFKSYFFIVCTGLSLLLFRWWYNHLFFAYILTFSLTTALLVYGHGIKETVKKVFLLLLILNPVEMFHYIFQNPLHDYVFGTLFGIKTNKAPIDILSSVSELIPVNISQAVWFTTDNLISFMISMIFLTYFCYKNFNFFIASLPILFIGILSFFAGQRYMIYLGPFIGIGFGFAIYNFVEFFKAKLDIKFQKCIHIVGLFLVIFLLIPPYLFKFKTFPLYDQNRVQNYKKIAELTEPNSYIWTWWGIGNPIQYYAHRSVYMDNDNIVSIVGYNFKFFSFIKSLITDSEINTYSYISFVTNHKSLSYLKNSINFHEIHKQVEDYQIYTYKNVYLLFYEGIISKFVLNKNNLNINEYNYINSSLPSEYGKCNLEKNTLKCKEIQISVINHDIVDLKEKNLTLYKKVIFYSKQDFNKKTWNLNNSSTDVMYLIFAKDNYTYWIIANEEFEQTMLYKMMVLSENNFEYFELVYEDYPHMVLYKVRDLND